MSDRERRIDMRWDERIDEMERRGTETAEDHFLMRDFATCLVGEALRDAGAPGFYSMPESPLRERLKVLGNGDTENGFEGSPLFMLGRKQWPALRARLAEIREVVSEHFPPPVVDIPALSVEAEKSEMVTA